MMPGRGLGIPEVAGGLARHIPVLARPAVEFLTLQGGKQKARPNAPAVRAQPGDLAIVAGFHVVLFAVAQQTKKTQACVPRVLH